MRTPTIHLNGTSKRELMAQHLKAGTALSAAVNALCAAAPNGRDYYVQGDTAVQEAQAEHESRIKALGAVFADLEKIIEAIDEQEGR